MVNPPNTQYTGGESVILIGMKVKLALFNVQNWKSMPQYAPPCLPNVIKINTCIHMKFWFC